MKFILSGAIHLNGGWTKTFALDLLLKLSVRIVRSSLSDEGTCLPRHSSDTAFYCRQEPCSCFQSTRRPQVHRTSTIFDQEKYPSSNCDKSRPEFHRSTHEYCRRSSRTAVRWILTWGSWCAPGKVTTSKEIGWSGAGPRCKTRAQRTWT